MKSQLLTYLLKPAGRLLPLVATLALPLTTPGATLVEFPFNEGEGTIVTDTASGLVGTISGAPDPDVDAPQLVADAPSGEAGDQSVMIGGNGYLLGTDTNEVLAFGPNEAFTIESWVSLDPFPDPEYLNQNEGILTYGGVYKLGLRSGVLTFTIFGEADMAPENPAEQQLVFATGWHHVAAAFEPGVGVTLYLDGLPVFVTNTTDRVPADYLNNLLVIGAERQNNNILGNLDRVRVHRGLLSANELDTDPANPTPVTANTVVAYNFDAPTLPAENQAAEPLPVYSLIDVVAPVWTEDDPEAVAGDFALNFGTGARVSVPDSEPPVISPTITDYTIETYVKLPETLPGYRMIMLEYRGVPGFSFSINGDGTLHTTAFRKADIASSAQVPTDGQWHHVAVVHVSGQEMRFYVDGELRDTVPYTEGPGDQTNPLLTIGMASSGANVFVGSLDRVRFSDAALTVEEFDLIEGAPVITQGPQSTVVNAGEEVTLTATFTAGTPRTVEWLYRGFGETAPTVIEAETDATLTIASAQASDAGFYSIRVFNTSGDVTSAEARVDVAAEPGVLEQVWALAPGDREYLTAGMTGDAQTENLERGMAYNPVTGNLLIVARETSPVLKGVFVVDAETGAHVGELDTTGISGGTFVLSKIGVADDGVIYAANFGSFNPTGTQTTIYRWANEDAVPTIAFQGNPTPEGANEQWGKNFAVRGSGTDTQILMETRRQVLALFTTTDGVNFTPEVLTSAAPTDAFSVGIAFGEGDTFWGIRLEEPLYHMSFDLEAGTASVIQSYENVGPFVAGIDVNTELDLLAGINVDGSGPDSVRLYDISDPVQVEFLDYAIWPTDNPNVNEAGNVAFGEGDMLFALNTNNGLVAYRINRDGGGGGPELSVTEADGQITISWPTAAGDFVLEATSALGPDAEWTTVTHTTEGDLNVYRTDPTGDARFFRLRAAI